MNNHTVFIRVVDPGGVDVAPVPTFKKEFDPNMTHEKKTGSGLTRINCFLSI